MDVRSAGRTVEIHTSGTGPGLVLVHGGGVALSEYRATVASLAKRFTVYSYSRYTEPPGPYDLDADIALLHEVLAVTGARRVLGHSVSGFLILHAAATQGLPVDRIAVYDAAVSIDGSFPSWYVEPFADAVAAGDIPLAVALVGKGLRHTGPPLPIPVGKAVGALFVRTPIGQRMAERFPTVVGEARAAVAHDGPAAAYASIEAETLLAYGGAGPEHYGRSATALAAAMPHARALAMPLARHDTLNRAGRRFMTPIEDFLAG